jgi:hypothetical protein
VSVCMCMWKVSCESVCALGVSLYVYAEGVSYECVCVYWVVFVPVFNVHNIFSFHVNLCLGCLALL